jgi:hypothetical protein
MSKENNLIDKNYRMQIVLDEEAMVKDNEFNVKKIKTLIDKVMVGYLQFIKGKNGWYYGKKGNDNYSNLMSAHILHQYPWFKNYLKKWYFIKTESLSSTGWVIEDWTTKDGRFTDEAKYKRVLQSI